MMKPLLGPSCSFIPFRRLKGSHLRSPHLRKLEAFLACNPLGDLWAEKERMEGCKRIELMYIYIHAQKTLTLDHVTKAMRRVKRF